MLHVRHLLSDAGDDLDCCGRSLCNGLQHVDDPGFPIARVAHRLKVPVVVRFVTGDEPRQVEHRDVEQPRSGQIKYVEDAPDTSVPIRKRVDAFELMMDQSHLDERIEIAEFIVVDEPFERRHVADNFVRILGGDEDDLPCLLVLEGSTRCHSKSIAAALQQAEHVDERRIWDQAAGFAQACVSEPQSVAIQRYFFGRRGLRIVRENIRLKQFILRCDDVFDFRRSFGFLKSQRVDQDALVRNGLGLTLQIRKRAAGASERLQDRNGFDLGRGWQGGNGIGRL